MTTWIVLRAAGIGAYLMLFASVAWGLIATTTVFGKRISKATAVTAHQFISTIALLLLGVHLGGLLLDQFVKFRPIDLLVPLLGGFKPLAVALGIIAMYATVIVLASSWTRKQVGPKWWRRLHMLTVPAFLLALVHGVFAGTDTVRPWMWWTYVGTGAVILFLLVVRALTADLKPERHARPAAAARPTRTAAPAGTPVTAAARTPAVAPAEQPAALMEVPAASPPEEATPPMRAPVAARANADDPAVPPVALPGTVTVPVQIPHLSQAPPSVPGAAGPESPAPATVVLRVEVSIVPGQEPRARVLGAEGDDDGASTAALHGVEAPDTQEHDAEVLPFERLPTRRHDRLR